jgi:RNA ligase
MKYPRTFHFHFSPGATNDDRIAPDFDNLVGKPIVITEKLDGENTCLNHKGVFARSHSAPTRNPWAGYLWQHWDMLNQSLGEIEIFGESLFAIHSLTYTGLDSHFYVFAIRQGELWLDWEEVKMYAGLVDFPTVPVLFEGILPTAQALQKLIDELVQMPSSLSDENIGLTPREGIVARVQASFSNDAFPASVLKWVRENHVQTDEHWTRHWKRAPLRHEWKREK